MLRSNNLISEQVGTLNCIASEDLYVVNTSTIANFKQPTWCQLTQQSPEKWTVDSSMLVQADSTIGWLQHVTVSAGVRKHLTVRFLCAVSYLSWALSSLSVPVRGKRSRQASTRREIKEMGCLPRISFISFSIWWKGLFTTLFCYGSPLGLMASIASCFLGKLVKPGLLIEATGIYTLTEFNKAPLLHQSLGPHVFLSFSLSISGWLPGAQKMAA